MCKHKSDEASLEVMLTRDVWGKNYRDTRCRRKKIIGIRDIWKKKYGDIQREVWGYETAQLRGLGIFEENVKGIRDTQTPLMGPLWCCWQIKIYYCVHKSLCFVFVGSEDVVFPTPKSNHLQFVNHNDRRFGLRIQNESLPGIKTE